MDRDEFSPSTIGNALDRQGNKCGSCGTTITVVGLPGQASHKDGEPAQAHHMRHCQQGGTSDVKNCVVLCYPCHYSVHNGGHYRNKSAFLIGNEADFQFYDEKKVTRD